MQAVPQLPQLALSMEVSTHELPQVVWLQKFEQNPFEQVCSALHLVLHEPQLAPSVRMSTHWPEQSLSPAGHSHFPALHDFPPVHLTPHPPQLLLSVAASTHAPEQYVPPPGQTHLPAWHVEPAAHALSQLPQCAASLCMYTHWPLHSVSGEGHIPASPAAPALPAVPELPPADVPALPPAPSAESAPASWFFVLERAGTSHATRHERPSSAIDIKEPAARKRDMRGSYARFAVPNNRTTSAAANSPVVAPASVRPGEWLNEPVVLTVPWSHPPQPDFPDAIGAFDPSNP